LMKVASPSNSTGISVAPMSEKGDSMKIAP
jgi:hypothetical protein